MNRFFCPTPRALAVAAQLLLVSTCAQAHPGHDLFEHGARHAITSPYHAGMLAAIGVVCWLAAHFAARRAVPKHLLRWAGATALLASAALWCFGL